MDGFGDLIRILAVVIGVGLYLVAQYLKRPAKPQPSPPPQEEIPIPEQHERPDPEAEDEEEKEEDPADIERVKTSDERNLTLAQLLERLQNPEKVVDDPSKRIKVASIDRPINQPILRDDPYKKLVNKKPIEDDDQKEEDEDAAARIADLMLNPKSLRDAIIVSELINRKY